MRLGVEYHVELDFIRPTGISRWAVVRHELKRSSGPNAIERTVLNADLSMGRALTLAKHYELYGVRRVTTHIPAKVIETYEPAK